MVGRDRGKKKRVREDGQEGRKGEKKGGRGKAGVSPGVLRGVTEANLCRLCSKR